jgi:hypothetical protein
MHTWPDSDGIHAKIDRLQWYIIRAQAGNRSNLGNFPLKYDDSSVPVCEA